jgi:hypothetical protein
MKTALRVLLIACIALLAVTAVSAQQGTTYSAEKLIAFLAASDPFAEWLSAHPGYIPESGGPDEDGLWYIEFYDAAHEEWLGYAKVHGDTLEITESFAPLPLPPDVFQAQMPQVLQVVEHDAEVLAWLNDLPDLWDVYADWNRWDQRWEVYFVRGIQKVAVYALLDEAGDVVISDVLDPDALTDEQALAEARNSAINLAYSAPGLDQALAGHDDWTTLAQQQGGDSVWGIAFVDGDTRLLFVLVDVASGEVLSAE